MRYAAGCSCSSSLTGLSRGAVSARGPALVCYRPVMAVSRSITTLAVTTGFAQTSGVSNAGRQTVAARQEAPMQAISCATSANGMGRSYGTAATGRPSPTAAPFCHAVGRRPTTAGRVSAFYVGSPPSFGGICPAAAVLGCPSLGAEKTTKGVARSVATTREAAKGSRAGRLAVRRRPFIEGEAACCTTASITKMASLSQATKRHATAEAEMEPVSPGSGTQTAATTRSPAVSTAAASTTSTASAAQPEKATPARHAAATEGASRAERTISRPPPRIAVFTSH